jgi:AraC-like DNA-binding protein
MDIGRQSTTGFSSRTGRDDEGLRLIMVKRGSVVARVGAVERSNDVGHPFGFLHPEADGTFNEGYASIALRIPFSRVRASLALLDCDLDPLRFVEKMWGRGDLPGLGRFQSMFNHLLLMCEEADSLVHTEAFGMANEQIVSLHIADLMSAAQGPSAAVFGGPASLRACVDFIHSNSQEQFELADMVQYAGISLRTAQAQFARYLGTTISGYLRSTRLDNVKARLSTSGDGSVTDVAFEEGFTHLGEFSRWYFRRFGEKPSETLRVTRMRRLF